MADCSQTDVFLEEWYRFCRSRGYICSECPMGICCKHVYDMKNKGLAFIQKWSDEHPLQKPKTYADVFFEQHPKATRLENGRPRAYRCEVYGCECKYKLPPDVIESTFNTDRDPCKICWNEPYPEQEVSNG